MNVRRGWRCADLQQLNCPTSHNSQNSRLAVSHCYCSKRTTNKRYTMQQLKTWTANTSNESPTLPVHCSYNLGAVKLISFISAVLYIRVLCTSDGCINIRTNCVHSALQNCKQQDSQ